MVLIVKGNRLFTGACVWMLLGAAGYMSALVNPPPLGEEVDAMFESMSAVVLETGTPMTPTVLELLAGVWIQVGVFLGGIGLINLVALACARGEVRVKRGLTIANLVVFGSLSVVFVFVPIPQALIVVGVSTVLLSVDLALSLKTTQ